MDTTSINVKSIVAAVAVIAGTLGAGTYMGWTMEPKALTECRVENAVNAERLAATEKALDQLVNAVEQSP